MNRKWQQAVVVANGDYPTHLVPLRYINEASYLISCDGAADQLISKGIIPDFIVGDGDSISLTNKDKYSSIIKIYTEQETNDLTKAITFLMNRGYNDITIVGATGKREDHTLGNISLLMEYIQNIKVKMITDYGVFYPCIDHFQEIITLGSQVSIINFGATHLKTNSLVYPIRDFTNWWQGTLNESSKELVEIDGHGRFLVFVAFK